MVADLLEAHQHIHHPCRLIALEPFVLVPDHLIIQVLLTSAHPTSHNGLRLLRKLSLHILLESAEEEGSQHSMQLLQYFLTDGEVLLEGLLEGQIEPLIEIIERVEDLRHEEMQERPQFCQIIL